MNKKTILFHSYTLSALEDLIIFSNNLKHEFHILFIILDDDYVKILDKYNVAYICLHCLNNKLSYKKPNSNFMINSKLFMHLLRLLKNTSLGQIIKQFLFSNKCTQYINISKLIMKKYNIDLLTTYSDGHSFELEISLIKAAKDLNIPIMLPFIKNYNFEPHYLLVKNDPQYRLTKSSSIYQKIVLPKYKYQTYKDIYFFPSYMFVVLSQLNILSIMPWLNGGGASDLIILPNKLLNQKYIDNGINENKIKILGDLSYIGLHKSFTNKKEIKKKIVDKYKLVNEKIIIIGLANWWEHHFADEKTHWNIVTTTIESTLKSSNDYSVLITLHPSMKLNNYLFLEEKYNVKIIQEKLMYILPIADIYVADQSSTVQWSILCGVKTLIVSYYRDMNLFSDFNSVVHAKKENEISEKLKYLISSEISFNDDWDLLSRDIVFTDQITNSYIETIHKLINNKKIEGQKN